MPIDLSNVICYIGVDGGTWRGLLALLCKLAGNDHQMQTKKALRNTGRPVSGTHAVTKFQEKGPDMSQAITELPDALRRCAGMISGGEKIAWGRETALMLAASDEIERLRSHINRLCEEIDALELKHGERT